MTGSIDNSLEICKAVHNVFPNNIEIIKKGNAGVSKARNDAIPYIRGEYVEFLDSDDILSNNTLEEVYGFFQKYKDEVDLVAIPVHYFEGRQGEHYLNKKFHCGESIIDLKKTPQNVLIYITSVFIKSDIARKYRFDERLTTCEDAKYLIQVLLDKQRYGIISSCKYNYRVRANEKTSLSQKAKQNSAWYGEQLMNYPLWAQKYCLEMMGEIPQFVKYTLASHLQWRFKRNIVNVDILSASENKRYRELLKLAINLIDDKIIDDLTEINEERKRYMKYYKIAKIIEKEN